MASRSLARQGIECAGRVAFAVTTNVWDLPGPANFVRRVTGAFRDGRSACVQFPRHAPGGFPEALRSEYNRELFFEVSPLHCGPADRRRPVDLLFEEFARDAPAGAIRDVRTLTLQSAFCGRLIFLESIAAEDWKAWRQFLVEYEQVCRNVDRLHRTLFFASLDGETATPPLVEDVCQAVFRWSDTLDALDMTLFAASQLAAKSLPALERQLYLSLLAELSGWDTEACSLLASQTLETLLSPSVFLRRLASQRGWSASAPTESWWELGIENSVNGFAERHSAFIALCGDERELDRRIWRAQLRVLFPAIEELRLALLPQLRRFLRFPVQTPFGIVREIEDLEIGQLAHQLLGARNLDRQTREIILLLKDLRHALAHLEPVRDPARLRRLFQAHEQRRRDG